MSIQFHQQMCYIFKNTSQNIHQTQTKFGNHTVKISKTINWIFDILNGNQIHVM